MPRLILFVSFYLFWRLIKRDIASRPGVSSAIWIPTIWLGILASRPISSWIGFGGGSDTLEGSPMDRLFFFVMIFAAMIVLSRRGVLWSAVISENWPIFLFYGFLLISVLWANSPVSSFKRWFKEFGNIMIALVILTEEDPLQAIRSVFVRCGYVLIPLSIIFIRWFPALGRRYNEHSGLMEATGVTFQKNSLGAMVVVCGLVIVWDWFERRQNSETQDKKAKRNENLIRVTILAIGIWLLHLSDSKTSIVILTMGVTILTATRFSFLRQRLSMLGVAVLVMVVGLYVADQTFHLKEEFLSDLGRDSTLTGRTDVWRELRNVGTDPIVGTGFMSFWDDESYRAKLPYWVAFSAHNGYLETYLAGGWTGIFFLSLMLIGTGLRINQSLLWGGDYAVFRFAVFAMTVVVNYTESNFACMTPEGFLFLLAGIGYAQTVYSVHSAAQRIKMEETAENSDVKTATTESARY
ncbi:MAG TPA: O-antigen ligase family protein [Verrucomicrobiae bacterium]|nr:O-antigen ligase family protein [Verrucomicrobiae bacterium]